MARPAAPRRPTVRRALLTLAPLAVVACFAAETTGPRAPVAVASASAASVPTLAASAVPAASAVSSAPLVVARRPPSPPRAPAPMATAPMAGAPAATELAAVRLEDSSCRDLDAIAEKRARALIERMRAEVAAQYQGWHDAQPGCWAEYRRRDEETRVGGMGHGYAAQGYASYGSSGAAYGSGGMARKPTVRMGATSVSPRPPKAKDASATNTQVEGVDEADLVKTDGRYVYFAMNGALRIVEAMNPRLLSTTRLPGQVKEMFIEGDRAVVYSAVGGTGAKRCTYGYDCALAGDGSATTITVLDVRDRGAPRVVRTLELSGSLIAARRIERAVHTVVSDGDARPPRYSTWPEGLETCGTNEGEVRRRFAALKRDNERRIRAELRVLLPTLRDQGHSVALCEGALRAPGAGDDAFTTVVSFDLQRDAVAPVTATIQSRPGAVFASTDGLYFSVVQPPVSGKGRTWYPAASEVSAVHKFRLGAVPRQTRYVGSGVVPGHVLNQFSMDQWGDNLRIATSIGRVPDPNVSSSVSILHEAPTGNLVRVGAVDGLAPSEDIRAVRFDDDRGYVVTFKKTDPLFVLDLYDPAAPRVLGELKIPGFSTYMHRIDPDHLLSIGFDANDHGDFAYFDGIILQLFDVSSPTEPRLLHKEKLGTRGSTSEAATDHLAFNYMGDRGLLAFPMTLCEGGGDGTYGGELAFSGLYVYTVDVERGFTRLGGVDHGTRGVSCQSWWSQGSSLVKRSVILDDLVYSVALDRAKVQRLGAFGTDVADISLE